MPERGKPESWVGLFLERGYAATTVDDIASRAGVSGATFFNYVAAKSDLLWLDADDVLGALERRLERGDRFAPALFGIAAELRP